jgi:hypothetical protein
MESNSPMLPSAHDVPDCLPGIARHVTMPADGGRGPSIRALIILAISAFALIATTPGAPTIERNVIGEVVLGGGGSVERELRIHVDPAAGDATRGSIDLTFQAASGLQASYTREATLALASASDEEGPFQPDRNFPLERCRTGCNLTYGIAISADPSVLPGSIVRYEVDVRLEYDYNAAPRSPALLGVDLAGMATGPVAPIWALLAGIVAVLGGIAAGPAIHRSLEARRRRLPGLALAALAVGAIAWIFVQGLINIVSYDAVDQIVRSPLLILLVADPWSVILLGTLGWGVWRGLRRWPADGGWLLGLSALAVVGLGGLWLAWRLTLETAVQPVLIAVPFVVLGGVGGVVIGQAWRTDERARHDRWWGTLAVLSHGILIAGFAFLAEQSFFDPFSRSPTSLLALIPAALMIAACRRWFSGKRFWLAFFDIVIVGIGVLGLFLWSSNFIGLSTTPARLKIDDVGVYIAVGAALVAVVAAFHEMPRGDAPDPIEQVNPVGAVADPPTK